jgi:hypothetical protein
MRRPANGISPRIAMSGSEVMPAWQVSRVALSDHSIQENSTTSPGSRFNAMVKDVCTPSGTSSPQASTKRSAPCLRNAAQAARA